MASRGLKTVIESPGHSNVTAVDNAHIHFVSEITGANSLTTEERGPGIGNVDRAGFVSRGSCSLGFSRAVGIIRWT